MGLTGIGWWIALGLGAVGTAVTYLWPGAREFGYALLGVGTLSFIVAALGGGRSIAPHLWNLGNRLGAAKTMLLVGIAGTWLFVSIALGAAAWMIAHPFQEPTIAPARIVTSSNADGSPLFWSASLGLEGGPGKSISGNVFSLRFYGKNGSQKEVRLKNASIISAISGATVPVEILAQGEIVPIDQIELIPPGAPIEMIAKFGPPDPQSPEKILRNRYEDVSRNLATVHSQRRGRRDQIPDTLQ
ncbi:hypothetical protein ACQPTN_23805 [Bradyrhizobium sp. 13971]